MLVNVMPTTHTIYILQSYNNDDWQSIFGNVVVPGKDAAHLHTLVNASLNPVTCAASWLSNDNQVGFWDS